MEYFVLKNQQGNPALQTAPLFGKLDVRKLTRKAYKELPKYLLLEMKTGVDIFYPDIITEPLLLVSKEALDVFQMYDSTLPFLFVVLFDVSKEESRPYYLPVVTEGDEKCREPIYRIRNRERREIRIRLDVAESLLWRNASGFELVRCI